MLRIGRLVEATGGPQGPLRFLSGNRPMIAWQQSRRPRTRGSPHDHSSADDGPHPRRRRRAEHHRSRRHGAALRALRRAGGAQRPRGARHSGDVLPGPRRPRHHDAGHRRLRGGSPPAQRGREPPGALPHGARRDRRQGARPHPGRRRLYDQAVQRRGARGAHPRHPAPRATRGGGDGAHDRGRPRARRGHPRGAARRPRHRAHGHRVQALALPHAQRPPGALQGPDPRPRVELRLRRQRQHRRDLCELLAAQDRQSGPAAHPDDAWRGLHHPRAASLTVSLRTRLLLALLGLVAVGLLVAGIATYSSLRSFLLTRVDQQLRGARGPVAFTLASGVQIPDLSGAYDTSRPPPNLPSGTYGELRGAGGAVLNKISFAYGSETQPTPRLPSPLPGASAQNGEATLFDTGATSDNGPAFRVLVQAVPQDQRVLVVAVPLTETTQTMGRLLGIETLVFALVLAGLAVAAWLLIKRDLRPLEAMADTAGEIAAGDLTQRVAPAEPRTEVGRLGLSLNAMLEQIEVAFAERAATEEKLRRFLADASHELRTPLTSIRGYAEVFERGAKDDPEDLATAMRRIEEESRRMGVMVDGLPLGLAALAKPRQQQQ